MASRQKEKLEETRLKVLRVLSENPKMSTRELADKLGISNGSAYYCLKALVLKGWIKLGNFASSDNKGRYAYILTPRGLVEKTKLTEKFLKTKIREFNELRKEIERMKSELEVEAKADQKNKSNDQNFYEFNH